jgi:hypothetical protein
MGNTGKLFLLLNNKTGREINNKIVRPYRKKGTVLDIQLIDICKYNNLMIKNGFFKHKQIHKYMWIQRNRNLKSIIDYIIYYYYYYYYYYFVWSS